MKTVVSMENVEMVSVFASKATMGMIAPRRVHVLWRTVAVMDIVIKGLCLYVFVTLVGLEMVVVMWCAPLQTT